MSKKTSEQEAACAPLEARIVYLEGKLDAERKRTARLLALLNDIGQLADSAHV